MKQNLKNFSIPLLGLCMLPGVAIASDVEEQKEKGLVMQAVDKVAPSVSKYIGFSGYVVGRYAYDSSQDNSGNFDIRLLRLLIKGGFDDNNFGYLLQFEGTGGSDGFRTLDAWLEWKKYDFFQIRAGQMKRCFTIENNWSPVTLGVPDYSQSILNLSGFTDRVGEHSSGGRDIGIKIGGNLFKMNNHHFLRYDVGVYNGAGINKADNNKTKDLIASMYLSPIKNFRFGGGYWLGEFGTEEKAVDRKRWNVGFVYDDGKYLLRGEYTASKGKIFDKPDSAADTDGWYITAGMPVAKKLTTFVKYDVYRDDKTINTQNTKYMVALNWDVTKYLRLQASYFYTDNNATPSKCSNNAVAQMYFTF